MRKKIFICLLSFMMILSLLGCSKPSSNSSINSVNLNVKSVAEFERVVDKLVQMEMDGEISLTTYSNLVRTAKDNLYKNLK